MTVYGVLSPGSWIVGSEADRKAGNEPHSGARGPAVAPARLPRRFEQRISSKSRMIDAPLSKEEASELYSIMGHLEGFAGRQAAALPKDQRNRLVAAMRAPDAKLHRIACTQA